MSLTADQMYDEIDGEPMLTPLGVAVLFGVTEEQVRELGNGAGASAVLPSAWIRQGKRRSKEYQAHTGRDDMRGALHWWADREGWGQ